MIVTGNRKSGILEKILISGKKKMIFKIFDKIQTFKIPVKKIIFKNLNSKIKKKSKFKIKKMELKIKY